MRNDKPNVWARARSPEKNSPGRMQILHYNIDRFPTEITDLRGLETLLVTTWVCPVRVGF